MSVQDLLFKLERSGVILNINGEKLAVKTSEQLTSEQREFIKQHKKELMAGLKDRLEWSPEILYPSYSYRFVLKNGAGAGTFRTEVPPENIIEHLEDRFIGREVELVVLIN